MIVQQILELTTVKSNFKWFYTRAYHASICELKLRNMNYHTRAARGLSEVPPHACKLMRNWCKQIAIHDLIFKSLT